MATNFSPIRSLCALPYCRSTPCSKQSSVRVRSSVSFFRFQELLFCFRASSRCLLLLSHLSVPSSFPSITSFRRQFLRKMWPIHFAFLEFIVCKIFLNACTPINTSSFLTRSVQLIFSIVLQHDNSKLSRDFCMYFAERPSNSTIQSYVPN
jgi:hypothetical protein